MLKIKVAIIGFSDTALYTNRVLAQNNINTFLMGCNKNQSGYYSKYGKKILYPDIINGLEDALNKLAGNQPEILFVIPTSDSDIEYLNTRRRKLNKNIELCLPDENITRLLLDKTEQFRIARECGLHIPKSYAISKETIPASDFPVFLRPHHIQTWKKKYNNKGIQVSNHQELKIELEKAEDLNEKVEIQQIIPGSINNNYEISFYIDKTGKIIQSFTIQKILQWPLIFGSASMTVSVYNKKLMEKAMLLLKKFKWKGFANIEFKYNPVNQKYYFKQIFYPNKQSNPGLFYRIVDV